MPFYSYRWNENKYKELKRRREAKKQYWLKKGCSERKAEQLLSRYGY